MDRVVAFTGGKKCRQVVGFLRRTNVRAVVTGGAGFLGSHLCEALLARGDEVVCLDNFLTGSPDNVAHLMHHKAVLGPLRTGLMAFARFLIRRTTPLVKLH